MNESVKPWLEWGRNWDRNDQNGPETFRGPICSAQGQFRYVLANSGRNIMKLTTMVYLHYGDKSEILPVRFLQIFSMGMRALFKEL